MNVKMEAHIITFKITSAELQKLRSGAERLEIELPVGQRGVIAAALVCDRAGNEGMIDLATHNREACLTFRVPVAALDRLDGMGRDREGMRFDFPGACVFLQVDFRTQEKPVTGSRRSGD